MMTIECQKGYITIMTVIIASSIVMAVGLSALATGLDSSRESYDQQNAMAARMYAHTCAEYGLETISNNLTYIGSGTLTTGNQTCTYMIISTGITTRTITTLSTAVNNTRKVQLNIVIIGSDISVLSWQDI